MREAALASAKYQRSLNRKLAKDDIAELKKNGMVVTELSRKNLQNSKKRRYPYTLNGNPKSGRLLLKNFKLLLDRQNSSAGY